MFFAQKFALLAKNPVLTAFGTHIAITCAALTAQKGDGWLPMGVYQQRFHKNNMEDVMRKLRKLWTWLAGSALMLTLLPTMALAAKKGAPIVVVADTRKLDGILYWWAEMYNESHFFFAIMTMAIIPVVGCVLGFLADIVMRHIGIDLEHRELAEK